MSNKWQPATRQQWHRLAIAAVALSVIGVGSLALAESAGAQTDVSIGDLSVGDVNQTVEGNVSDVRISTTLNYDTNVPDAERRTLRLEVGPGDGKTAMIDYASSPISDAETSGTVTLEGSLTDHPSLSAADFDPDRASSKTVDLTVNASLEVTRESGESVVTSHIDTATVTINDAGELVAELGGSGEIVIETEATE